MKVEETIEGRFEEPSTLDSGPSTSLSTRPSTTNDSPPHTGAPPHMRHLVVAAVLSAAVVLPVRAQVVQARVDLSVAPRIREEGLQRSRLDSMISHMTDVLGPRLTNSPANRAANAWAAETMRGWGLASARVEPWDSAFGRGWERLAVTARVIEPYAMQLVVDVQAWSGSTRGRVSCPVVVLEVTDTMALPGLASRVRGACVLRNPPGAGGPEFEAPPRRSTLRLSSARRPSMRP